MRRSVRIKSLNRAVAQNERARSVPLSDDWNAAQATVTSLDSRPATRTVLPVASSGL